MTPWFWWHVTCMKKNTSRPDEPLRTYSAALESYLQHGDEAALHRAYEFGRRSLAERRSILDLVSIHNEAVRELASAAGSSAIRAEEVNKAGEFFAECISPFEMTHRAFGEANRALRALNEILEEQARVIGRDLHDQAGQLLAAVHIQLDEMSLELSAENQVKIREIKGHLDAVENQLRNLSHELRPTVLDDLGLCPALQSLSRRVAKRTGLRISPPVFEGPRLPMRVELALYRIVQEALNNVTKHARATSVRIRLRRSGHEALCAVEDNGVGFDPEAVQKNPESRGLGLLGISERLQAIQGKVRIQSAPGKGTKLRITIPLEG